MNVLSIIKDLGALKGGVEEGNGIRQRQSPQRCSPGKAKPVRLRRPVAMCGAVPAKLPHILCFGQGWRH